MRWGTLILACISLLVSACAKDKSLDDWKREKLEQELAKLPSGTFSGTVLGANERIIGPLSLTLMPTTKVTSSPGNYKTDEQAMLEGSILFGNEFQTNVSFTDGSFNSTSGSFKFTVPLDQRNGRRWVMSLSGTITGDRLTGRIGTEGNQALSGQMVLVRDAVLPTETALGLRVGMAGGTDPLTETYEGSTVFYDRTRRSVELVIMNNTTMFEENFLNRFLSSKPVQVTLRVKRSTDSVMNIMFADASWNKSSGALIGQSVMSYSDGWKAELALNCRSLDTRAIPKSLSCEYVSSSNGEVLTFTVTEKATNDQSDPKKGTQE